MAPPLTALNQTAHTPSSPAAGAGLPGADSTSKVASARMTGAPSTSGTALTGDASADYDFQKNLEDAESLFLKGRKDTALSMFSEIHERIKKANLPETSLFPLRCLLGLIYSSSVKNNQIRYFADFATTLVKVDASRKDWHADDTSSAHSELRWLLNKFRPLIPKDQSLVIARIDEMIAECTTHILPIDAFHEMVKEADEAVKTKNLTTARALCHKALALIPDKFQIEFAVAKAACLLKLTKTYESNDPARAKVRDRAQETIFSLFDQSTLLYEKGKYTKIDAFRLLIGYLRDLRLLTLDNMANHSVIQKRINACKLEIPEEFSETLPSDPHRKVTSGSPDGSWNLRKLFIAVICIAVLAVATVALYRRYTVKLN